MTPRFTILFMFIVATLPLKGKDESVSFGPTGNLIVVQSCGDAPVKMDETSWERRIHRFLCTLKNALTSHLILPKGYYLQVSGPNGDIHLYDPSKHQVIEDQISQFQVAGNCIYGWIDKTPRFFFLDTSSKEFRTFCNKPELDSFTSKRGISRLDMNNSFTFWDITGGYKQPTWKQ